MFAGTNASDTNWFAVRAQKATFTKAVLQRASFMFADLRNAVFDGANLRGAFFIGSDLRGASFNGAILDNTDFTGAIVDGIQLTPDQIRSACETPMPAMTPGQFAYAFSLALVEVIPNQRFDGGYEYARFIDAQYPFDLLPNGLDACKPRDVTEGRWSPVSRVPSGDRIRTDASARLSHKLLQQPGRRAAVRERVEQHFAWLWQMQKGRR